MDKLLLSATKQRYQSASEVLKDLNAAVKPVSLKPRSSAKKPHQADLEMIDERFISQKDRQLASLEAVASYLPLRADVSATVFDSATKTWHDVPLLETLDGEKSTRRLSPRLAAVAATPPIQKDTSAEEDMAEINDCLKWWRIITLTIITSLAAATLVMMIAAIESKLSTIAPKVETVEPVQGSGSSGQR
ncbi:MAG: hypothetical protein LH702_13855 [Phormidesmis sp. CAN_BIN44]|nr:hypothetical protein [Phormidesmis sp. CAN_BIN44]